MIVARKTDGRIIYMKLSLLNEDSLFEGYVKCHSDMFLPQINRTAESHEKIAIKKLEHSGRLPKHNQSVLRIFNAISQGKWDEVNFSMQFVAFEDSYYNNQTAAIASLFCENPNKRRLMMKTLMKWNLNFKIPDLVFQRDPIHWCCVLGYIPEYELIINYLNDDIDYHLKDVDGNTYLHLAVISNCLDLVMIISQKMMFNEISADITNSLGFTPYILSRKLGNREISKYIQSIPIASPHVFDNVLYKSPREWSILGNDDREKSQKKLKINKKNLKPFQIPKLSDENTNEPNTIDIKKVIHSAYIIWANQHADSFRKLAHGKDKPLVNTKLLPTLPQIQKKNTI